jgi:hypothetical protein
LAYAGPCGRGAAAQDLPRLIPRTQTPNVCLQCTSCLRGSARDSLGHLGRIHPSCPDATLLRLAKSALPIGQNAPLSGDRALDAGLRGSRAPESGETGLRSYFCMPPGSWRKRLLSPPSIYCGTWPFHRRRYCCWMSTGVSEAATLALYVVSALPWVSQPPRHF